MRCRLLQFPQLRQDVQEVMQGEISHVWKEGVTKIHDKVKHLKMKWMVKKVVPKIWEGVLIGDEV